MIYLAIIFIVTITAFLYWGSRTAKHDPSIHVCAEEIETYIKSTLDQEISDNQIIPLEIALIFQKWNTSRNKTGYIVNMLANSIRKNTSYDDNLSIAVLQMIQYGAHYHLEAQQAVEEYRIRKTASSPYKM